MDISDHKGYAKTFLSDKFVIENKKAKQLMIFAEISSRNKAPSLHSFTFY